MTEGKNNQTSQAQRQTFSTNTSLWIYIGEKGVPKFQRIHCILAIFISTVFAIVLCYFQTLDFIHATIVTSVDSINVPLTEIYFPSVVLCNNNQIRQSYLDENGLDIDGNTEKLTSWSTHQECKDLHLLSKWDGVTIYNFAIERDLDTDFGICCWFTPQLNLTQIKAHQEAENLHEPDWGFWMSNVPKSAQSGKENGYKMILDLETFDYTENSEETLKLSMLHYLDIPTMKHSGIDLQAGSKNQIVIKPTLISTSCGAIERFQPRDRDCYTDQEVSLKFLPQDYGYRYALQNCYFQSTLEMIVKTCHCFPTFHPIVKEFSEENYEDCVGEKSECANQIFSQLGNHQYIQQNRQIIKCLPSCEDQINEFRVNSFPIGNSKSLTRQEEFCVLTQRLVQKCSTIKEKGLNEKYGGFCETLQPLANLEHYCSSNVWNVTEIPYCSKLKCPIQDMVLDYASDNLVVINMYFEDFHTTRFIKDEKMTVISYVFGVAMILVICFGWSVMTIAEIFYYFVLILKSKCSRTRKEQPIEDQHQIQALNP